MLLSLFTCIFFFSKALKISMESDADLLNNAVAFIDVWELLSKTEGCRITPAYVMYLLTNLIKMQVISLFYHLFRHSCIISHRWL